jgi:hypothetical protein
MSETKVDEMKPIDAKPRKFVRRSVAITLGIICILLAASLIGACAYFVPMVNDKNNTISSLNAQISSRQSEISELNFGNTMWQGELNSLLNGNLHGFTNAILNITVTAEGNLTAAKYSVPLIQSNLQLVSGNQSIDVLWHGSVPNDSAGVKVTGFLRQEMWMLWPSAWFYYIEAETVEPL